MPWRDEEGQWQRTCPWPDLGDAMAAIAMHSEWSRGIHPVSTGRAPWIVDGYFQAMREVEAAMNEQRAIAAEKRAAATR